METTVYKSPVWPRVTVLIALVAGFGGMFLPWLVRGMAEQTVNASIFDPYYSPLQWVILASIIITALFVVLAIVKQAKSINVAAGTIGIIASIVAIGAILLFLAGSAIVGSSAEEWGIEQSLGVGFYVSLVAMIAVFIFSIASIVSGDKS